MTILHSDKPSSPFYPQHELLMIVEKVRSMCEMVNWELDIASRKGVKDSLSKLEYAIRSYRESVNEPQMTVKTVTRDISEMKHLMNQCVCQYYKVVEKAMIIPCDGYVIEGINKRGSSDYDYLINLSYQDEKKIDYASSPIDHMDTGAQWYRSYFMNQPNCYTFIGYHDNEEPLIISTRMEIIQHKKYCRIISRDKKVI
ncbi:hypothetical protein BDB01DRAFT_179754 [Pilobolus umbonatus]|nr:hypothetical protein BDB01DRAFT_179754 [Pilobolus umbonatus]